MTRTLTPLRPDPGGDALIRLLQDLIRIPSDNPPGTTTGVAEYIREYLAAQGLASEIIVTRPGIANIVSSTGEGAPHLIVNGHLDTLPADVGEPWHSPPHSGARQGDRIYGRGAGDMKGGLASLLCAFARIGAAGHPGRLTFIGTADEEMGGEWGALWLLEHRPDLVGNAVLNGEPSGLTVRIGEKARVSLLLEAAGKAAHGSFAGYVGENAILKMARILPRVAALQGIPARLNETTRKLTDQVMTGYRQQYGHESATLAKVLREVTINVGTIAGGSKDSIVPAQCAARVDARLPIGISPGEITDMIRETVHAVDPTVTVRWACPAPTVTEATYSALQDPITRALADAHREIAGTEPLYSFTSGATDCRYWRKRGVPAVSYGPRVFGMGAVDEHIRVDDLETTAKVHEAAIRTYLSNHSKRPA